MRYDDRLRTVLDTAVEDPHDRAVRWRQVVELLARGAASGDPELLSEGLAAVRDDAPQVDEQIRMATARTIAPNQLPSGLISAFAADRLTVAAPVLAAARLTALEWGDVTAHASPECRKFIHTLRSDESSAPAPPEPAPPRDEQPPIPSISEVVARIERVRHGREQSHQPAEAADTSAGPLFRWESDEAGDIAWIEGAPRGPLIGRSLARSGLQGEVDHRVERAFAERMPFSEAVLELDEGTPLAGRWKISGTPAFDSVSGRFAGYRGIAEREGAETATASPLPDADSIRELAHEIKTPLNAIVGFAEIISGQYLGPADHRYRERASEIVEQARLLLTAIEDLDFAAKLHSRAGSEPAQVNLGELVERIVVELREIAESRGAHIDASRTTRDLNAKVDPELADRLVKRMCTAAMSQASEGETLRLSADSVDGHRSVTISLPQALSSATEDELFGSADSQSQAFPFRLVRGLARIANAELVLTHSAVFLLFRGAGWRRD